MNRLAHVPIIAAVLVLSACSSGLTTSATDACNFHSSWVSEGQPKDRRELMVATASAALGADDDEAILKGAADMTAALGAGDDAAFAEASAAFSESCQSKGWEPPEG